MEVKTVKIQDKRYLKSRMRNGAWELLGDLTDEQWEMFCADNVTHNRLMSEKLDLERIKVKGLLTPAGESRLIEVKQILNSF